MTLSRPLELVGRYVAIWNEPNGDRRHVGVAELWTEDAIHLLEPPEQVVDAADALDVAAVFQARGHAELEARVSRAHREFVEVGGYSFRATANAARLGEVVKFGWEMVSKDGDVAGAGLEFAVLAPDGRIRLDYQFIER